MTIIWGREATIHRHNQQCEKHEVVMGRAHRPHQRRQRNFTFNHSETIRQENATNEANQAVERRPGQLLERHDLADDSARLANLVGMLRHLLNHGTLRLPNDDDDDGQTEI